MKGFSTKFSTFFLAFAVIAALINTVTDPAQANQADQMIQSGTFDAGHDQKKRLRSTL